MGYGSDSGSLDGRDEDDEEDYEENGGSNRLLGFMFGNVDNSGDLDVDYLDEDAKEHLSALADKLGSSLTDIDTMTKKLKMQLIMKTLMSSMKDQRFKLPVRRTIYCLKKNIFLLKFHWLL